MENLEKLINSKFETVNVKLDGINTHLTKQNGTLERHDKVINDALVERARYRQELEDREERHVGQEERIEDLEHKQIEAQAFKRFVIKTIAWGGSAILGAVAIFELIIHLTA